MGWFDRFRRGRAPDPSFDVEDLVSNFWKMYLKGLAVDKSLEFLARSFASSEFHYLKDGKRVVNRWSRLLNLAPNLDESAPMFWQRVIYRLLLKNEVLIVLSDDNQLLIADGYTRRASALYEDVFEGVAVKGYQFKRRFPMSEVIFLQYNNNHLMNYVDGLFKDYETLYHKLNETIARNNQIRSTLGVNASARLDDEVVKKMKSYAEGLLKSFQSKSVAIVPLTSGIEYKELTNTTGTSYISVEELKRLRRQFDDEIAEMIGIPTALLHGEMANLENSQELFYTYCLRPLLKKVSSELTAKITRHSNEVIEVLGIDRPSIFDLANSIDKLIASGAFNRNEVRKALYYEEIPGGDVFVMTKNYQEEVEKGDENDNHSD